MSILSQLGSKKITEMWNPKEGVQIPICALSVGSGLEDFGIMAAEGISTAEMNKAMLRILDQTLQASVPDSTEEERKDLAMEHLESLMEVVMKVNKLEGKSVDTAKLDKIKQLKAEHELKQETK